MKINNARAIARVLGVLYRLKILSAEFCDRAIDNLTVKVLKEELSKRYPKDYLKEDLDGESAKNP